MSPRILLPALGGSGLAVAIGLGFVYGDGRDELAALTSMPWGVVTLLDLYLGFALFLGWVWHRERHVLRFGLWAVALCLAGNVAACVYVVLAAVSASRDERMFWHGQSGSVPGTGSTAAAGGGARS
ncbi:MAG: DUF1475 family protein [Gammaproteobacteria bacterium]|nr:DUF1475 domain-containing protein [Gammaproteobacteria bacterium]NNM01653.1 DUF1475 family protein [Gammaproteobacteria bacterium]